MREKVKVLTCCCHYDDIVNYDFFEDDVLTKKLIQYYQDFIFNVEQREENLLLIKQLDEAVYKYIDDYHFAKSLRDRLDVDAIASDHFAYLDDLMHYIVKFFNEYDETAIKIIPTRWI